MNLKSFVMLVSIFFSANAFATAQAPDYLVYQGEEHHLHVNPLKKYFEANPEKRIDDGMILTALWRGYVATFVLEDGKLAVQDIVIIKPKRIRRHRIREVSVIKRVFPAKEERFLRWYLPYLIDAECFSEQKNTPADCGGVAPLGSFPDGLEVQCPFDSIDSTKKPINFTWWWPLDYDAVDAV